MIPLGELLHDRWFNSTPKWTLAALQERRARDAGPGDCVKAAGQPCSQGSSHSWQCWGMLARSKTGWVISLKAVGVLTRRLGRGWRRKGHVWQCCPHTCAMSWGWGPGSALRPPRNGGGKLGHSSAPLTPHGSSGKSTCSLSFHGLKVLQNSGCSSGKWETELQGAGSTTFPQHTQLWAEVQQLLEARSAW